MPFHHVLLALSVVIIWGLNFIFVKLVLTDCTPLLLCTARFFMASIPAVFFIKPPAVPWKLVVLYGLVMFALQFSLLFTGMYLGMTPGMASIIMQTQVFFSMFFSVLILREKLHFSQILGALVSFVGIGLVAIHFDHNITLIGFVFILGAAASWGLGNLITKKIQGTQMMALVVWGSFVAAIPMILLSLIIEGQTSFIISYQHFTIQAAFSLLYIVLMSTWVGYGAWNWLLSRYPMNTIVPFSLLVPVVGLISSVLILGEPLENWKIIAGLFVITGLCINLIGTRIYIMRIRSKMA